MVARAAAQAARASARDARQAAPADVLDCSAPATRELLARPEAFLDTLRGRTLLLDDVGRLANARELLWLAANRFPTVRILTTSTLPVGTGETDSPIAGGTFAASGAAGASGAPVSAAAAVPGWPPTSGAAYQGWPAESAGGWPPVAAGQTTSGATRAGRTATGV